MGIGMQIAYLGFPGSSSIEAEAAVQLLRLHPYSTYLSLCRLEIENLSHLLENRLYEVRLEIETSAHRLRRVSCCVRHSVEEAIQCAFRLAVRALGIMLAHGRL
ncbi:conserved hypothetical protein [Paraburkholderia ribeironis]|uniref:Uncharacterized protein n=1 Tax=Paraburkholderia ribeironis TaxID=1247936 RepID=A0A1N7SKD8_9BURK|nr:conserved hypothetical protein [Paraburkholderia ribeironis]